MPEPTRPQQRMDAKFGRKPRLIPRSIELIIRRHRSGIALGVISIFAIGLVVAGLLGFSSSRTAPQFTGRLGVSLQQASKTVGETAWKDVLFYKEVNPSSTILTGLGVGLLSYLVTEIVGFIFKQKVKSESEARFQKFFGSGSLSRLVRGKIILQSDNFEDLIKNLTGKDSDTTKNVVAALNQAKNNRLYKARKLVNARDAESAKIIREELRRQLFPTPELSIIDRPKKGEEDLDPFIAFSSAPYLISMGLGFTETTLALALGVGGIEVDQATEYGDAISIRDNGLMRRFNNLWTDEIVKGKDENGEDQVYVRFFPKKWEIKTWDAGNADVKDYAVIVRHTATLGRSKQVRFALAGFTEDATVAAGRYFATWWDTTLYDLFQRSSPSGDFVAIITGLSKSPSVWSDEPEVAYPIRS